MLFSASQLVSLFLGEDGGVKFLEMSDREESEEARRSFK